MNNEVNLYNVSDEVARNVLSHLEEFNRGRREDTGFYAVSTATEHRTCYALWRIFPQDVSNPIYIKNLAITFEDAVCRAMECLKNCNVRLQIVDNSYFEPYYSLSDDIMPFGKYRGKRMSEIYCIDPFYVLWLANKFEIRNRKEERIVVLARGFRYVYLETVVAKKQFPAISRYVGKVGEKLKDMHLTVLSIRLQVDSYRKDYFVDQNVLAVDTDGNRFRFMVKAAAASLSPEVLSCYSRKINVKEHLHLSEAKVLSHYENKGVRYTRLGFVRFV